jgi:hypothetical protein
MRCIAPHFFEAHRQRSTLGNCSLDRSQQDHRQHRIDPPARGPDYGFT